MRILLLSDINAEFEKFSPEAINLENYDPEVVLVCGNITNFGLYETKIPYLDPKKEVQEARDWLESLADDFRQVYYILGTQDLNLEDDAYGESEFVHNITDKGVIYEDDKGGRYYIYGCSLTPIIDDELPRRSYDIWQRKTVSGSYEEKQYYQNIPVCDVLVSHAPPFGRCGLIENNKNCGSEYLRRYIKFKQPKLVACGYNTSAKNSLELVGNTTIANVANSYRYIETL